MCKCILVCDREDTEQFFVCIVLLRILFPDLFHLSYLLFIFFFSYLQGRYLRLQLFFLLRLLFLRLRH